VDGELRSDQRSAGGHWRRHRLGRRRDLRVADPIRFTDVAIADLQLADFKRTQVLETRLRED